MSTIYGLVHFHIKWLTSTTTSKTCQTSNPSFCHQFEEQFNIKIQTIFNSQCALLFLGNTTIFQGAIYCEIVLYTEVRDPFRNINSHFWHKKNSLELISFFMRMYLQNCDFVKGLRNMDGIRKNRLKCLFFMYVSLDPPPLPRVSMGLVQCV